MTKYTDDFKRDAIKLSDEIGIKKAAAQLGLSYYTIADWRQRGTRAKLTGEGSKGSGTATSKAPTSLEEANRLPEESEREKAALKSANAELQAANEILKDALGFLQETGRSKDVQAV